MCRLFLSALVFVLVSVANFLRKFLYSFSAELWQRLSPFQLEVVAFCRKMLTPEPEIQYINSQALCLCPVCLYVCLCEFLCCIHINCMYIHVYTSGSAVQIT